MTKRKVGLSWHMTWIFLIFDAIHIVLTRQDNRKFSRTVKFSSSASNKIILGDISLSRTEVLQSKWQNKTPWQYQCSGSMTFWGGSESAAPCFWLMYLDPAIFVIDLKDASKKLIFNTIFSAYYFLKVHLHHFSKIINQKVSQNRRNQGFSYYSCMMIEGSGSIPLTKGSGSGRPKNMWIRNSEQYN
jgi:hypothetical protein